MAMRDEIKAARKDIMENGSFKDKISYFFEYYTIHTIVVVAILIFTVSTLYRQVTKPEDVLGGIMLNVLSFEEDNPIKDLKNGFLEYIDMNTKEYDMSLNYALKYKFGDEAQQSPMDNYQASQAVMAQCSAGVVDFIASPLNAFLEFGYGGLLVNLEDVLSEEDLEKYEPYFLYVDLDVVRQKADAWDNNIKASDIPCPDPTKPEEMKQPIPVFIDVTKCEKMANIYDYYSDTVVIAITVNAPNPDRISDFLAYLFEE